MIRRIRHEHKCAHMTHRTQRILILPSSAKNPHAKRARLRISQEEIYLQPRRKLASGSEFKNGPYDVSSLFLSTIRGPVSKCDDKNGCFLFSERAPYVITFRCRGRRTLVPPYVCPACATIPINLMTPPRFPSNGSKICSSK